MHPYRSVQYTRTCLKNAASSLIESEVKKKQRNLDPQNRRYRMDKQALLNTAYAPYETIEHPTREDWQKAYDALKELAGHDPKNGNYPNTLGYICYYGRHTGERDYAEARMWFGKGADLCMIESTYKLADMMMAGQGGPKDPEKAVRYVEFLYGYCRRQFESGNDDSKFPDLALRLGRIFHEGIAVEKNDAAALGFLLEAPYALNRRKRFEEYGDSTVEKNILSLIADCEQPGGEMKKRRLHGLRPGRVPACFVDEDHRLTFEILPMEDGLIRLGCRRVRKDGKKPNEVLWSITPAMVCFLTPSVVLYAADVRMIWNKTPGEPVLCDRYEYDEAKDLHLFYLGDDLRCRLMGGDYYLSMDDFIGEQM